MNEDQEGRADTYVGAIEALAALIEGQVPGLSVSSETLAPLVQMLASEAAILRDLSPVHRRPAARACND